MGRTPHELQFGHVPRFLPLRSDSNVPAVDAYLEQQVVDNAVARDALLAARYRQADVSANRRNPKQQFQVGQYAFYKRRSYTKGTTRKLEDIWEGPYRITHVNASTGNCTLALPKNKRIYPIFATDKLKLYHGDAPPVDASPAPSNQKVSEDTLYAIEEILDHKKLNGKDYWYIKWANYGPEDNSWEPDENVRDFGADATLEYLSKKGTKTAYTSTAVTLPHDFFFPSDDSFCSSSDDDSLPWLSETH
jgi:hypothetical protein